MAMPGKIVYAVVSLSAEVEEVEEIFPGSMEKTNEVLEAYKYKAKALLSCKSLGGRSAGYSVVKVNMSQKPEDENYVWVTKYVGLGEKWTMGVHGNERGAVATKERGLKREADLGVADGDPFEIVKLQLRG